MACLVLHNFLAQQSGEIAIDWLEDISPLPSATDDSQDDAPTAISTV